MQLKQAKAIARQWVIEEASTMPGFAGAFYHGSAIWSSDDALLPPSSDLDIMIALDGPMPSVKLGKFCYRDVLLEISYLPFDELQSPEQVLGLSHLAGSFRLPSVIVDPTGHLTQLQTAVARDYAKRQWVQARCEHAIEKILGNLQALHQPAPFHDHVMAWLFATGVTTHVLLVAGLQNPTVRRRYEAVRELLARYGQLDLYENLLELLGCAQMSREQVEQHLAALAKVFDVAKTVIKTPVFFASDISDASRPIAIDGSQALIERGLHREAMFWIVATYSRCQKVLYLDAPAALQEQFHPGYLALLADLGIVSLADLVERGEQVKAFLPRLRQAAEAIMAANPGIE